MMGNSIRKSKKKVQTEQNLSPSLSLSLKRGRSSSFWLLERQGKLKAAGPKGNEDQKRLAVHYRASQHYQENVFIEGSRPWYLEDLHSEAQEGLKIQQQQEHRNRLIIPDHESIASSENRCVEQDTGFPESRSNSRNPETSDPLTHKGRYLLCLDEKSEKQTKQRK